MPPPTVPLTVAPAAGDVNEAASVVPPPPAPFCTVIGTLNDPVAPAESRTVSVSVWAPSATLRLFQAAVTGPLDVLVVVETLWPATASVNVREPAAAPLTHIVVHTAVPLTTAPLFGCVIAADSVPPPPPPVLFWTETARLAVAVAPALSRTVSPSV